MKFLTTILKYQVQKGLYLDQDKPIPTEAIALYITSNPMNELKTMFQMMAEFNTELSKKILSETVPPPTESSPESSGLEWDGMNRYKSILHQNSVSTVVKIDVDTKDPLLIDQLDNLLKEEGIVPKLKVETRGGYHYLIGRYDQTEALWKFTKAKENSKWLTIEKNGLIAIPGTIQGGFQVKIKE